MGVFDLVVLKAGSPKLSQALLMACAMCTAERIHDDLLAVLVVGARLFGDSVGHRDGRLGLSPARQNPHHANSLACRAT